ncbi:MAG TPA: hypothetical protein VFB54_12050 [Burkholderiales bacterium]|nr:hypothetical protein [Burkholderiales bacterium]
MSNGSPHHHDRIDISVWLDREAADCIKSAPERAHRLREAATLIRTQRANLVAARFQGQRLAPRRASERRK